MLDGDDAPEPLRHGKQTQCELNTTRTTDFAACVSCSKCWTALDTQCCVVASQLILEWPSTKATNSSVPVGSCVSSRLQATVFVVLQPQLLVEHIEQED